MKYFKLFFVTAAITTLTSCGHHRDYPTCEKVDAACEFSKPWTLLKVIGNSESIVDVFGNKTDPKSWYMRNNHSGQLFPLAPFGSMQLTIGNQEVEMALDSTTGPSAYPFMKDSWTELFLDTVSVFPGWTGAGDNIVVLCINNGEVRLSPDVSFQGFDDDTSGVDILFCAQKITYPNTYVKHTALKLGL